MLKLNPNDFGLKENPFGIVPSTEVTHWAGMRQTRNALEDVISSVRPDDIGASECVVMHGDFGAGKSHALRFFAGKINQEENFHGRAIYLSEVTVGASPSFAALYPRILEQIAGNTQSRVSTTVQASTQKCVEQIRDQSGFSVSSEEAIKNKVAQDDQLLVKELCETGNFLKNASDDMDAAKKLASIFRVMTTPIGDAQPPYGAAYLFLDEMENVNVSKAASMQAFYGTLRALINGVNEHFALVLSFSQKVVELDSMIPPFMQERLTRPYIECAALSQEEAKLFIKEYIGYQRPEGFLHENPFHPFSEEAIDIIFERETSLIPRRILMHMRRVWERASRREGLQPGAEISREMADEILSQIGV